MPPWQYASNGTFGSAPTRSGYTNRRGLGQPWFVAVDRSRSSTAAGDIPNPAPTPEPNSLTINAATPVTCGDAIDVPWR